METPPPLPPPLPSPLHSSAHLESPTDFFASPSPASASISEPFIRDRIVVLGRTQAGKTVFIARLYHELWSKPQSWLSMRALSGPAHTSLMTMCAEMANGRWPSATTGQRYVDCELKFNTTVHRMTILDYPGEVFTKAFVRGESDTDDTTTLLEHVDHAKGVILLIDPKNAVDSRDPTKRADDDYGMAAVVDRIRKFPGGEKVPIAIVMTKCDLHESMIIQLGGLKVFADEYLHWIIRTAVNSYKIFPCAAVRLSRTNRSGTGAPDLAKPPVNVIEPLKWILEKLELRAEKSQLAAEREKIDEVLVQAIAQVRAIVAQGATNANCVRARKVLSAIPNEHQGDRRVRDLRAEIDAAVTDHEDQHEKKQTRNWIFFGAAMFVLIPVVIIVLYKVFSQGK